MPSFDRLAELLMRATKLLDEAAREVRDLQFNASANVRVIGEAMCKIFDVCGAIYEVRPDLKPDYLNDSTGAGDQGGDKG
jgi:hypothetical protein